MKQWVTALFAGSLHPSRVRQNNQCLCLWLLSAEKQNEKEAQVIRNVPEDFPSKSCTASPEGFHPLLEGLPTMLCFEWVGKDACFHLSVMHLTFRAGHYKLTTDCVHAVPLLLNLDLLVNGFMEAISNMWYELLHYLLYSWNWDI